MANKEHVALFKQGSIVWNAWWAEHPNTVPNLAGADLAEAHLDRVILYGASLQGAVLSQGELYGANFERADLERANLAQANLERANFQWSNLSEADFYEAILYGADFRKANLHQTDLRGADLRGATLQRANLNRADFRNADLERANLAQADLNRVNLQDANLFGVDLQGANLRAVNLQGVNLSGASLQGANLQGVNLQGANLQGARLHRTVFADSNLRQVQGLDTVKHHGPSTIGIDTLIRSKGQIAETFLRGCGVPDSWIEYIPSLIGSLQPIQYYSCFISYSTKDEAFAQRLHGRLQQSHVRVWYAPHDLKIDKLYGQIDEAIRVYDKLLLILSEESIQSNWVETELRLALKKERSVGRRVLFPVRLTSYEALEDWSCFDGDTKRDLASDVRSYYIGDFTGWKDHDTFEASVARLLSDLRSPESVLPKP